MPSERGNMDCLPDEQPPLIINEYKFFRIDNMWQNFLEEIEGGIKSTKKTVQLPIICQQPFCSWGVPFSPNLAFEPSLLLPARSSLESESGNSEENPLSVVRNTSNEIPAN
jgi:hypothetical protein